MRGIVLFVVGAAAGFIAAHQIAKTPQGRQFFDDVDERARQFGSAIVEGYKEREAELRAAVAEAEEALADFGKRSK